MKIKALIGGLAALLIAQAVLASEARVTKAIEPVLAELFGPGIKPDAVRKLDNFNLYEIQIGGDLLYTDERVSYLINGDILDIKRKKNLTEERKHQLSQVKFSDLPLDLAVKQVKGNGRRVLVTFEDPNCTYCRKLAKELQGISNVTIYTFVYPILSPDSSEKAKNIWCAPDRAKAWNDLMLDGKQPASASCNHPAERVAALGRRLNIRGVPAMIFADGTRVPGYLPADGLERALDRGSANVR
ncbi:MAG: DsbC family protein [Sulfuritalea sp.]|nr:DsbC family protein [Sulfuritalea sp.]